MSKRQLYDEDLLLRPEIMVTLYSKGAFPMADELGHIDWYMPDVRTIIPLDTYNYPRSLRKFMEHSDFEFRFDKAPLEVIKCCADRSETWISDKLIGAYKEMIKHGHLHSVETYSQNTLVGGLYGIVYKGAFFGESMFSKASQASKVALIKLIEHLKENNFLVLDVQYQTDHLKMFGTKTIAFKEFEKLLSLAYSRNCSF